MSAVLDVAVRLNESLESRAHPRMSRSVNASAIGHPCERKLVYDQVRQSDGLPELQPLFALGVILEKALIVELSDALAGTGYEAVNQQALIPENKYGIGGIIDLFLERRVDGKRERIPVEFKTCSPFIYPTLNTLQDLRESRFPWVKNWAAQLTIYMLLTNNERGILLMRNKVSGRYKQIDVPLDYEFAESLLAKAERVTAAVDAYNCAESDEAKQAALPERIPFDPKICESCPHYRACYPDITGAGGVDNRLWDVQLDGLCARVKELEPAVAEHDEAMKQIREHAQSLVASEPVGSAKTSITERFFVTAKSYQTTSAKIPPEVRSKYIEHGRGVRVSIKPIGTTDDD